MGRFNRDLFFSSRKVSLADLNVFRDAKLTIILLISRNNRICKRLRSRSDADLSASDLDPSRFEQWQYFIISESVWIFFYEKTKILEDGICRSRHH